MSIIQPIKKKLRRHYFVCMLYDCSKFQERFGKNRKRKELYSAHFKLIYIETFLTTVQKEVTPSDYNP